MKDSKTLIENFAQSLIGRSIKISIEFGGNKIVLPNNDMVVENIIQDWLEDWLRQNYIEYVINEDHSLIPPYVFLDPQDKKHNLMEVKAFNYAANPGFDIADFRMYEREIKEKPWMLDVDYLVFGYDMSKDGVVTVKNLWLKKVLEICRPIRPAKWYGVSKSFKTFECVEDFLSAVEETVYKNKDTRDDGPGWLDGTLRNYETFYGKQLRVPRWYEIESKYYLKNKKK